MTGQGAGFESKHFQIERLAEGVYAAIHREGGWAIANAGIVDLGDGCLVFDTFLTPAAGADLRRAAEVLTGQPVRYIVNSHYHNDHIWGNQSFPEGASIISSELTRQLITTEGQKEYEWYSQQSQPRLQELEADLEQATDPQEQEVLLFWLNYYRILAESMPGLNVRLPDLTFKSQLQINGTDGAVELLVFDRGHTGGDCILYLASEAIIFTADLLFVQTHPYLADGDPEALLSALESIKALKPRWLLPGHGPVGTIKDIEQMIGYVKDCQRLAAGMVEAGIEADDPIEVEVPAQYAAWDYPVFFQANVGYFVRELLQTN